MSEKMDSEDAKKLHESRKKMYTQAQQYRTSFIDPKSGLIKEKHLEYRACPVCGSNSHHEIFKKNGGTYVSCCECSMVFLNPVFKDSELILYYQMNNSNQAIAHGNEAGFYNKIYNYGLELICHYVQDGNLLDIGCSSGFFLDIAAKKFSSYGIELNKSEVEIARSKGHYIWDQPIKSISFEERNTFNAITLWDVFEHIKDGKNYLESLRSRLQKGGIIFLQIPSADALAARIMHEKCNMFDGIEHVNLYNPKTISELAESAGYKILKMKSVIDEIKPTLNYLNYENPYSGSFDCRESLAFLTPDLIHKNFLGYKLQVILTPK